MKREIDEMFVYETTGALRFRLLTIRLTSMCLYKPFLEKVCSGIFWLNMICALSRLMGMNFLVL